MTIFDFTDYKEFTLAYLETQPKRGRGVFRKMALHMGVNPVIVSQVFKGPRHLSHEQAYSLCGFYGFATNERDYFLLLIDYARAGTFELQKHYLKKIEEGQQNAQDLKKRLKVDKVLTEEAKAVFYSHWYYSAFRMLSTFDHMNRPEDFAEYFNLPLSRAREILEFLLSHGLCEEKNGKISLGARRTHVGTDSPLVSRHHQNWRLKSTNHMENLTPEELFFTGPMSIEESLLPEIRKELVNTIDRIMKKVGKADGGRLVCLNIDWFRF